MPTTPLGAIILNVEPAYPKGVEDTLDFSVPRDNGIRIISSVSLLSFATTYYGDQINLQFWKLLKMKFGLTPTPSNPLTLQPGYRYVYNHGTREFDAYDNNGVNFVHISNIMSIADLNIDFTIHKSHQFEIIIDPASLGARFIFPAKLVKETKDLIIQDEVRIGVDNICPLKMKKEPVITRWLYLFDMLSESGRDIDVARYVKWDLEALNFFWDIDWNKNLPTNRFYLGDRFSPFAVEKLSRLFNTQCLSGDLLLPFLSQDLYPNIMPVQRGGETQNNRPVYEPWLMVMFNMLYNKRTVDEEDTFVIPVFDLSPRFV